MSDFFILVETASGYALFQASGVEEIGSLETAVQKSVKDFSLFKELVQLKAFQPFSSAENALENIMNVSENIMHKDLESFLTSNLPSSKKMKKKDQFLGVQTAPLAGAITDATGLPCKTMQVVSEVIRGIRLHLEKFISKLDGGVSAQAQLGLGHGYSRAKVKFNVNKQDNMLIQAICLLDQLDKDLNICAMRVKEWYSWHFPELSKLLPDSFVFARFVSQIGTKGSLLEVTEGDKLFNKITEISMDEEVTKEIIAAAKASMGFDISELDLINLQEFSERVVELGKYRLALTAYLANKVEAVCPNLGKLIGDSLASRLISHAGSLNSLAKCPASTIQILGAEKALFRALKTKGNTPKYGLLFNSGFIGKAKQANKGRISRYLANKCALAARIDCFSEINTRGVYGDGLRGQVEERLKFLETGEKPRKNAEVMQEISKKLNQENGESHPNGGRMEVDDVKVEKPSKSKKDKGKKRKKDESDSDSDSSSEEEDSDDEKKKKKLKKEKKEKKKKEKAEKKEKKKSKKEKKEKKKKSKDK